MKEFKKIIRNINKCNMVKITILTVIIISSCSISIYIQSLEKKHIKINEKEFVNEEGKISVYISGAINNYGIYSFNEGTRLEEALNLIGGIKSDADISKINLSKTLYDSEKIVIPYIQKEEASIENEDKNEENISDTDKININEANESELQGLIGIGEATAKKIVEYRKNGDFESIEDIKKVSGIGDSKFEKIKDKITVE
ncbi:MAG: hypothetical protein K0R72_638 [Clostridia bacterium]|jgi:competence protein ComEA|nr:hypothetical protein [Clostridia bacterium]